MGKWITRGRPTAGQLDKPLRLNQDVQLLFLWKKGGTEDFERSLLTWMLAVTTSQSVILAFKPKAGGRQNEKGACSNHPPFNLISSLFSLASPVILSSRPVMPILVTRFTCYADLPVILSCYPDRLVSSLIFLSPVPCCISFSQNL